MIRLISIVYLVMFSFMACSDSPQSPVAPKTTTNQNPVDSNPGEIDDDKEQVKLVKMAVKFTGRTGEVPSRVCELFISLDEDDHDHDHDHGDHDHSDHIKILMKTNYVTRDGHKPMAGVAEFYRSSLTNEYFSKDSDEINTDLVLFSGVLKESQEEVDPNFLEEYITNVELEQSLQVRFSKDSDYLQFTEVLEEVIEGKTSLNESLDVLNTIEEFRMTLLHFDHYHSPACGNFNAVDLELVDFASEGDDHDHDHDHE